MKSFLLILWVAVFWFISNPAKSCRYIKTYNQSEYYEMSDIVFEGSILDYRKVDLLSSDKLESLQGKESAYIIFSVDKYLKNNSNYNESYILVFWQNFTSNALPINLDKLPRIYHDNVVVGVSKKKYAPSFSENSSNDVIEREISKNFPNWLVQPACSAAFLFPNNSNFKPFQEIN